MAGGGGTRLWPLSRRDRPKPFLPLVRGGSLLQATVERLSPLIEPRDVYIVTDGRYADLVREQLPDVPAENVVAEPFGRNTAAAVVLAAAAIDRPGDDVMVVLPADHQIADPEGFRDALEAAASRASDGDLVTLGIEPSGPETGYGYVIAVEQDPDVEGWARSVERFEEKPTVARALALLETRRAYWNAGIFVWRRDAVLAELENNAPDILEPVREAVDSGADLRSAYEGLRAAPIDVVLMEPASLDGKVAVVPVDVGWSDLGSWAALLDALAPSMADEPMPVTLSDATSRHKDIGSIDTLVSAQGGRLVATIGLQGVIVVDTPDALLVVSKDRAQDVKRIVDQLTAEGHDELL
jgi:mannose-1-phosphate guanylyltransferase/mannose-6-phosphate isomerase